jgi:hypothetical protein
LQSIRFAQGFAMTASPRRYLSPAAGAAVMAGSIAVAAISSQAMLLIVI